MLTEFRFLINALFTREQNTLVAMTAKYNIILAQAYVSPQLISILADPLLWVQAVYIGNATPIMYQQLHKELLKDIDLYSDLVLASPDYVDFFENDWSV